MWCVRFCVDYKTYQNGEGTVVIGFHFCDFYRIVSKYIITYNCPFGGHIKNEHITSVTDWNKEQKTKFEKKQSVVVAVFEAPNIRKIVFARYLRERSFGLSFYHVCRQYKLFCGIGSGHLRKKEKRNHYYKIRLYKYLCRV